MVDKHTIHIDMSGDLSENKYIGIAFISNIDSNYHKGIFLSSRFIKSLKPKLLNKKTNSLFYSFCIFKLIRDEVEKIEKVIICNDYPFNEVKQNLMNLLKYNSVSFDEESIESLLEYKKIFNFKIKSLADSTANKYRKRGINIFKAKRGDKLNLIKIKKEEFLNVLENK